MNNAIPDVARSLAELARTMNDTPILEETLRAISLAATTLIDGADAADILTTSGRRQFRSHGATSDLPVRLDTVQEQTGEGPCVDAAFTSRVVRSDDLTAETRWPRFCPQAVEIGVHSALSFQLYAGGSAVGALNVFALEPHAFSPEDEEVGLMLATHAAVALQAIIKKEQFESALASRDMIGQAKGMIMERFSIDAVQAFDLLRTLSQDTNTPVAQIAAQLIESGWNAAAPR